MFSFLFFFVFKETKNQWARDDPAFLVILMTFLIGMIYFYKSPCLFLTKTF